MEYGQHCSSDGIFRYWFYLLLLSVDVRFIRKRIRRNSSSIIRRFVFIFICSAAASIFLGRLLDKYSVKNIMLIGGVIFSCGLISIAYVQSVFYLLLIYATFIAIGGPALGNLSVTKLVANWFETKAGVALGIAAIGISFSGVILPILVDPLIKCNWVEKCLFSLCGYCLTPSLTNNLFFSHQYA